MIAPRRDASGNSDRGSGQRDESQADQNDPCGNFGYCGRSMRARTEWWFVLLALLPALATISVYTEAFLASQVLGHWPIPSLDDPKQLVTAPLHSVTAILVLLMLPAGIVLAAVSMRNWRLLRRPSRYWVWMVVFAVSLALFWLNPSTTWEWWWD